MLEHSQLGGRFDDLAMDEVSRQARRAEQGFTTEMFHGTMQRPNNYLKERAAKSLTGDEFNEFTWGTHAGSSMAAEARIRSRDLGGDFPPNFGDFGAIESLERARVFPLVARGKFVEIPDLGANWGPSMLVDESIKAGVITAEEGQAALRRAANIERSPIGEGFFMAAREEVQALIESKGFSGFTYINAVEDIGSRSWMIFRSTDIRSIFARFDPRNLGKPGMMGGLAALLGAGAAGRTGKRRGGN